MRTRRERRAGVAAALMLMAHIGSTRASAAADAPTASAPALTPAAPPPAPQPSAPPPPEPTVSRSTVALGAASVAAAGAIGATVFGVLALQNKSDYEKTPTYANTDNGNNFAAYADGCLALAIAAGVTSLVLYLTSSEQTDGAKVAPSRAPTLSATPVVMAHGGGAGVVLSF